MARKVNISNAPEEQKLKLNNGSLVIVKQYGNTPDIVYMVSSYTELNVSETRNYCVLLCLGTGGKAFSELCSRNTTVHRFMSHLSRVTTKWEDVTIIQKDDFSLNIELHKGDYKC